MLNTAENNLSTNEKSGAFLSRIKQIMLQRVWLPKSIYSAVPFFYIGLGSYATYAALFMKQWTWVIPYFLIMACGCLHAGILTASLRLRAKRRSRQQKAENQDAAVTADSVRQ